jgi:hypothetical protein
MIIAKPTKTNGEKRTLVLRSIVGYVVALPHHNPYSKKTPVVLLERGGKAITATTTTTAPEPASY